MRAFVLVPEKSLPKGDAVNDSALDVRLQGQFVQADLLFAWDYTHSEPGSPQRAEILLNWAEARRRVPVSIRPDRMTEARKMFNEGFDILKPLQNIYDKQYGALIHHLGRLERQVGNHVQAQTLVEQSIWRIRVCNKNTDTPYIDTLTTLLDAASLRAICGFPWRARLAALQALIWTFRDMTEPIESVHRKRALILFTFANWPTSQFGFVRRAFFGREALDTE